MLGKVYIAGLLLLLLLLGCGKDPGNVIKLPPQKAVIIKDHPNNTPFTIDSTLLASYPKEIKAFYRDSAHISLWNDENNRKTFLLSVAAVEEDGLNPKDYNYRKLIKYENNKALTQKESMAYDLLMTESFFKLANHLFKGKFPASAVYPDWSLKQKKLNEGTLLSEGLKECTIDKVLERCRPPHKVYAGLKKSLKYLNTLPDDSNLNKIIIQESIKENDSLAVVEAVKKRLAYWKDLEPNDTIGLIYDSKTVEAVKKFQRRHGIYPDGIIGKKTATALNHTKQQRKEQVIVNLERWRWFAYDFGEKAIIINIPDYRLALLEDNKDTIAMHKVVVGKPDRRTPVLYSKLNYLVINPTWTVPPTILTEDLTPKAIEDRDYFINNNLRIYDRDSNEIAPEDWDPKLAKTYRYVQSSGETNALGNIKFNYNNRFSVYLHDTNHKELFSMSARALSSGCIRVHKPFDLAQKILEEESDEWSPEKIEELVTLGETENIYLKKTNHVHQLYWTAWMDKNGLQFRNDIYNLDKALYEKLRN